MNRAARGLLGAMVAVASVLLVVAQADAQQGQGGGGGFRRGFGGAGQSIVDLLLSEQVQKELDLVGDQVVQIIKIGDEFRAQRREGLGGMRNLSPEDRQKRMAEFETKTAEASKKAEAVLLPHQRDRLKQISIQVRGTRALADNEVADALGLTSDQKQKLTTIREESDKQVSDLFQGGAGGGDREANRTKMTEIRTATESKTLAVLTDEQKAKFEQIKGKKFELERGQGGGGGRGNRGAGANAGNQ